MVRKFIGAAAAALGLSVLTVSAPALADGAYAPAFTGVGPTGSHRPALEALLGRRGPVGHDGNGRVDPGGIDNVFGNAGMGDGEDRFFLGSTGDLDPGNTGTSHSATNDQHIAHWGRVVGWSGL